MSASEYMKDHIFELGEKMLNCVHNYDDQSCLRIFIRSSFILFICILHHLRIYYEFTKWPASSLLDSSVDCALIAEVMGFQSLPGLNFFQALFQNCSSYAHNCDYQSCLWGSLKIGNRPCYSCVLR